MSQLKAAKGYLPCPQKLPNWGPQGILLASSENHGLSILVEKPEGLTSTAQQHMELCTGGSWTETLLQVGAWVTLPEGTPGHSSKEAVRSVTTGQTFLQIKTLSLQQLHNTSLLLINHSCNSMKSQGSSLQLLQESKIRQQRRILNQFFKEAWG